MEPGKKLIRIIIAEDHTLVQEGLQRLLDEQPDMDVVGVASDGGEACRLAAELGADVVLMDYSMPKFDGVQATKRITQTCPQVRVLGLTVHEDEEHLQQLLSAGAAGYVLKRAAAHQLLHAIREVHAGGAFLDPRLAEQVARGYVKSVAGAGSYHQRLSERETEILKLLAWGYTNQQAAERLGISTKTVETHRSRALSKLGLKSRADLVEYAVRQGWMKVGESPSEADPGP